MRAGHLRGMLEALVEFLRPDRLTQIESLCVHVNSNRDFTTLSQGVTGEECAGNSGEAE
jgi:hypothetical protein